MKLVCKVAQVFKEQDYTSAKTGKVVSGNQGVTVCERGDGPRVAEPIDYVFAPGEETHIPKLEDATLTIAVLELGWNKLRSRARLRGSIMEINGKPVPAPAKIPGV